MVKKTKLYMITDVHCTDAYADCDIKGVVIRASHMLEWESAPGWHHAICLIDRMFLSGAFLNSGYSDGVYNTTFYMIKVKEL